MRRYFSALFALIITLLCLAGCQKEPPNVDLPDEAEESVDTTTPESPEETDVKPEENAEPTLPEVTEKYLRTSGHYIDDPMMQASFEGGKGSYFFYHVYQNTLQFLRQESLGYGQYNY